MEAISATDAMVWLGLKAVLGGGAMAKSVIVGRRVVSDQPGSYLYGSAT
ncbi:hypothetical protein [Aliisedimentitalea sp. MJ-SS2]|nr:hypothetical protein [Alisedimentitalea sp. MJ-SS2]